MDEKISELEGIVDNYCTKNNIKYVLMTIADTKNGRRSDYITNIASAVLMKYEETIKTLMHL